MLLLVLHSFFLKHLVVPDDVVRVEDYSLIERSFRGWTVDEIPEPARLWVCFRQKPALKRLGAGGDAD